MTIALCLYLLGFVLTVACNSGSGSSTLARTVKTKMFSPWMVPLWLDLGFDYRLTYGQFDDADHVIAVTPWDAASSAAAVRFPATGSSGIAAHRWRTLAVALEPEALTEDMTGLLTASLAESLFDELGEEDLRVQTLRARMTEWGEGEVDAEESPLEQAAVARVRRVAGSVQLLPVEQQRDVAPLVTPAGEKREGDRP